MISILCSFVGTEPPDVDEDNADISGAESDYEDATSAKLLSKKQQVSCYKSKMSLLPQTHYKFHMG